MSDGQIEVRSPDVFTTGTVGEPGSRVFYLQVRDDARIVSLRCEKQQVAALAEYLDGLLSDLEPAPYDVAEDDLDLLEPVDELWTVGPIGVAYDDRDDRIIVVLEELVISEDDEPIEDDDDGRKVKVHLSRSQVSGFVRHSRDVVAAGRPPCRFCGLPVDPDGHPCPRMN